MESNGGYLASDKYSNSINDGEDFEIMELPVFQFGQLWGPDALLEYIYIEPYRCERLETPEPASLFITFIALVFSFSCIDRCAQKGLVLFSYL